MCYGKELASERYARGPGIAEINERTSETRRSATGTHKPALPEVSALLLQPSNRYQPREQPARSTRH
jgi:hypothetical protein